MSEPIQQVLGVIFANYLRELLQWFSIRHPKITQCIYHGSFYVILHEIGCFILLFLASMKGLSCYEVSFEI